MLRFVLLHPGLGQDRPSNGQYSGQRCRRPFASIARSAAQLLDLEAVACLVGRRVCHPSHPWVTEEVVDFGDADRRGLVVALVHGDGRALVGRNGDPGDDETARVVVAEAGRNQVGGDCGAILQPVTGELLHAARALALLSGRALGHGGDLATPLLQGTSPRPRTGRLDRCRGA